MEKIKNFFSNLFGKKKSFKEINNKNLFIKKEDEKIKKYNKIVNIISTLGIAASFYIVGKCVSKMQFMNALFKADFITPPDKFGHSDITGIDSIDDIIGNTIKLHKKGEIINC